MKRKYRIKELVHADGTSTFLPQYKEFFVWWGWLGEDSLLLGFKTRKEAEEFLEKEERGEQILQNLKNKKKVVSTKVHPFYLDNK